MLSSRLGRAEACRMVRPFLDRPGQTAQYSEPTCVLPPYAPITGGPDWLGCQVYELNSPYWWRDHPHTGVDSSLTSSDGISAQARCRGGEEE
jgi:hypothetical protein